MTNGNAIFEKRSIVNVMHHILLCEQNITTSVTFPKTMIYARFHSIDFILNFTFYIFINFVIF